MQGTVLAGLKCSVSIDTIGKECLDKTHDMSFKYKNCVSVPPLGFIDDILAITTCSPDSIRMNAIIQAKLKAKLLELGPQKCSHIHIGKKCDSCPTLNIYNDSMLRSNRERYLGDILTSKCKIDDNVLDRQSKGFGYCNEILVILKEITFGRHYFDIALTLRNAKLINGMLCSIESLYGLTITHIEQLEKVDKFFFKKIFNAVSSTESTETC